MNSQSTQRTVVMIAHDFPPEGSAGVYRTVRFVRHLPALGWHPLVVSCDKALYERYDPELLDLVPDGTAIHRVHGRDWWQALQSRRALRRREKDAEGRHGWHTTSPGRALIRHIARRFEAWRYHPDMAMGWIGPALRQTADLCGRRRVDAIWATAGPVSAFAVGQLASRLTCVPYVLDFRDSWTITHNDFEAGRPVWATRRDRRVMRGMLQEARAVIFRYHAEAECYWRAYPGALDASRVHIIPNGYDGAIESLRVNRREKCIVLYTGTLSSYRYDTLLEGLRLYKAACLVGTAHLVLRFVGEGAEVMRREADRLGVGDLVEAGAPVAHSRIAGLQREADALLILGRPPSMQGYELFAGAKLFEYLKAGRPIIGVLPMDETRNVLARVGVSTIADAESPAEIADVFRRVIDDWQSGTLSSLSPNAVACGAYSAERQTAAMARALLGRSATDPFRPGAVGVPPSLLSRVEAGRCVDETRVPLLHTPGR